MLLSSNPNTNEENEVASSINGAALLRLNVAALELEPFILQLKDESPLTIRRVIRVMPHKRMVVVADWRGQEVVAKIFARQRHFQQERRGLQLLRENKVPAPQLLYSGLSADKAAFIIITKYINQARSLQYIWETRENNASVKPVLHALLIELATQHVLGIIQNDLHLNNFLVSKRIIYTLDAASVEFHSSILDKKTSVAHIALFIAQLGLLTIDEKIELLQFYANMRGWLLKPADIIEYLWQAKKLTYARWQDYQEKIFRSSSQFAKIKKLNCQGVYARQYNSPHLQHLLVNPESFFQLDNATVLKAGRSSTVIKVVVDGQAIVVKRYNLKNFWHRMRRMFRETRAAQSWRLAHKLCLFQVPTAPPIAYVEYKFLFCRGTSYYITAYVPGVNGSEYFSDTNNNLGSMSLTVARMVQLLKQLFKLEITHGDLKITNFIINEEGKPIIIDFDGAKEHASQQTLHKGWRKEIMRFLANFAGKKELQAQFEDALR